METQIVTKKYAEDLDVKSSENKEPDIEESPKAQTCRKRHKAKAEHHQGPTKQQPAEIIDPQIEAWIDLKRTDYQFMLFTGFFFLLPPLIFFGMMSLNSPENLLPFLAFIGCSILLLMVTSYGIYSLFTIHRHIPSIVKGTKE